jgi:hypothetical protein
MASLPVSTSKPSLAPLALNTTTVLSDFSVLLLSQGTAVNLGQLERSLETYLKNGMKFSTLKSVSLTLLEGDSREGQGSISTSVRFSGTAEFNITAPPAANVRSEQAYLLEALPSLQVQIDQNEALQGVSVADVSFERIDPVFLEDQNNTDTKSSNSHSLGILLGVFSASVVAIALALLIVRRRRMQHRPTLIKEEPAREESPASITEEDVPETFVDPKPGCKSLCSGNVSLGESADLSTYMMTVSPRSYAIPASPKPYKELPVVASTGNNSPKRPTDEIVIRQDYVDDFDDNYLTTDETSVNI